MSEVAVWMDDDPTTLIITLLSRMTVQINRITTLSAEGAAGMVRGVLLMGCFICKFRRYNCTLRTPPRFDTQTDRGAVSNNDAVAILNLLMSWGHALRPPAMFRATLNNCSLSFLQSLSSGPHLTHPVRRPCNSLSSGHKSVDAVPYVCVHSLPSSPRILSVDIL
jgi:hypothetical protein